MNHQVLAPHSKQHLIFVPSVIAGHQEQILQVFSFFEFKINNYSKFIIWKGKWSMIVIILKQKNNPCACSCWTCTAATKRLASSMRVKVNFPFLFSDWDIADDFSIKCIGLLWNWKDFVIWAKCVKRNIWSEVLEGLFEIGVLQMVFWLYLYIDFLGH